MITLVSEQTNQIAELCRKFGVRRLELFGSATTDHFNAATSDLDFVVDFADRSPGYADRYLAFADALEELFERKVDLVTERSIKNPLFRDAVNASRQVVFYDERIRKAAA